MLEQRDLCPTPISAWRTTVKASDRERVFNDLFRTYGDIRLELAAERDIPHGAMFTLMRDRDTADSLIFNLPCVRRRTFGAE